MNIKPDFKFFECHGKDVRDDIDRWRISAYYEPHMAETLFFYDEDLYLRFIENHKDRCKIEAYIRWRDRDFLAGLKP